MYSHARHARPRTSVLPQGVLRSAVIASTAGAALAVSAAAASAEPLLKDVPDVLPQSLSFTVRQPLDISTPQAKEAPGKHHGDRHQGGNARADKSGSNERGHAEKHQANKHHASKPAAGKHGGDKHRGGKHAAGKHGGDGHHGDKPAADKHRPDKHRPDKPAGDKHGAAGRHEDHKGKAETGRLMLGDTLARLKAKAIRATTHQKSTTHQNRSAPARQHKAQPAHQAARSQDKDAESTLGGVAEGLRHAASSTIAPVKHLQLNPLAKTGVDPLSNSVGTQVADFKPVSTEAVTGPLARGASLSELPVVGPLTNLLPG